MHNLLSSKKAQFFLLSAFAIITTIFSLSQWIEPYTITDTSQIVFQEEIFLFNNIVEKANETIRLSTKDELKYNLKEFKLFVEDYAARKNLKLTVDISNVNYNPPSGYIIITLTSPNMKLEKRLNLS
jgi:hypothetical protein